MTLEYKNPATERAFCRLFDSLLARTATLCLFGPFVDTTGWRALSHLFRTGSPTPEEVKQRNHQQGQCGGGKCTENK
jgi:hypothetical protein